VVAVSGSCFFSFDVTQQILRDRVCERLPILLAETGAAITACPQ
jgi:hypothetical protein